MALQRYGIEVPDGTTDASIELMLAFNDRLATASGFLGRYQHLRNAIDLLWNEPVRRMAAQRGLAKDYDPRKHDAYVWNDWSELILQSLVEWRWGTTITGPNSSSKTTTTALYGLNAFFASPSDTIVVLTSTTLPGLRRRIWKEVMKYHRLQPAVGLPNASDFAIRFRKGSDESGIFGIATGDNDGDVDKAVNKIIGFHGKNVIAVVDEMQATNKAIVEACVSLEAGSERFQFIGLGNADSELDPHGRMSEPVGGWNSITPEHDRWETKVGICVHLDGLESPRIKEGDEFYPGLLKQSDIDSTIRDYGEDSPQFWSKRRGFWAPQGVQRTVLAMAMITKGQAREPAIWIGKYKTFFTLDPSFEGNDRCVLREWRCGEISGGKTVLSCEKITLIKVSTKSAEPIHYQIAQQVKQECETAGIGPEMFGLDSSGEGGGLASIIVREWGAGIFMCEFGGRASTDPVSATNHKRADMEYDRRVTELCMRFRTGVLEGQIRNLDLDTAGEFCQRRYEVRNNIIVVETKTEMKKRTGRSPDLMDNALVAYDMARKRGLLQSPEKGVEDNSHDKWKEAVRGFQMASGYAEV